MFVPPLNPWIKEWRELTGQRIKGAYIGAFITITPKAGQSQIDLNCCAVMLDWDNVIRLMAMDSKVLRQPTKLAAIVCTLFYQTAQQS